MRTIRLKLKAGNKVNQVRVQESTLATQSSFNRIPQPHTGTRGVNASAISGPIGHCRPGTGAQIPKTPSFAPPIWRCIHPAATVTDGRRGALALNSKAERLGDPLQRASDSRASIQPTNRKASPGPAKAERKYSRANRVMKKLCTGPSLGQEKGAGEEFLNGQSSPQSSRITFGSCESGSPLMR